MPGSRVLYSKEEINKRIKELARQIASDYKGEKLVVVGILKGSFIVMSDLVRMLYEEGLKDIEIDFLSVSSYGKGTTHSGTTRILADLSIDVSGRAVLLVEDIIDTGHTFTKILSHINEKNPSSVKIFAFLDKKERREVEVHVDYIGFTIVGSPWVEGYGLDGGEYGRGRPDIAEKILT